MGGSRAMSPAAKQALAACRPRRAPSCLHLARARRRGNCLRGKRRGARDSRAGSRSRCRRSRSLRKIIGGCAARARFSPAIRSKARAPSSSASATSRDPAALRANRDRAVRRGSAPPPNDGTSLKAPPKTDPIVAGWLELGPVAVEIARNPMQRAAALENWKRLVSAASGQRQRAGARAKPDRRRRPNFPIRSRCCCRCRAAPRRSASRCATASSPPICSKMPRSRPHLKIYDVAAESVGGRLQQRHRRRRRLRRGPAHQGGRRRRRAVERRPHAGAGAEFSRATRRAPRRTSINSRCCRKTRRAASRGASWPTAGSTAWRSLPTANGAIASPRHLRKN